MKMWLNEGVKKTARHQKKPHTKHKKRDLGLIHSPAVAGLMGLLPVLVLVTILGVAMARPKGGEERELFLKAGEQPNSAVLVRALSAKAADSGDVRRGKELYLMASELRGGEVVLGASSELEERLWPESKWEKEWERIEEELLKTSSAQLGLRAARIKKELGEIEEAKKWWKMARQIDPNDDAVVEMGQELNME